MDDEATRLLESKVLLLNIVDKVACEKSKLESETQVVASKDPCADRKPSKGEGDSVETKEKSQGQHSHPLSVAQTLDLISSEACNQLEDPPEQLLQDSQEAEGMYEQAEYEAPPPMGPDPARSPNLISKYSLDDGNFFKGVKWSPDGSTLLTCSRDTYMRLFSPDLTDEVLRGAARDNKQIKMDPYLKVGEPEIVYDYCWHPLMHRDSPELCCFATSSKDQPVHLWDSLDGSLRGSYLKSDDKEVIQSAYSMCISPDGTQLLCGYKKELSCFYLDRPGNYGTSWPTYNKRKRRHRQQQTGIVSCLQFSPSDTARQFACGCYDGTVGLYDERNGNPIEVMQADKHGLTQVRWSQDGYRLYAGFRRSPRIVCWDVRYMTAPIFECSRLVATNQRLYFDAMPHDAGGWESVLASGDDSGHVVFWRLDPAYDDEAAYMSACELSRFRAHDDCANGCAFCPTLPVLATTSGQRVFPDYEKLATSDDDEESEVVGVRSKRLCRREDNSLKLWILPLSPLLPTTT